MTRKPVPDIRAGMGRREVLRLAGMGAMVMVAGNLIPSEALASAAEADAFLKKMTGAGVIKSGKIKLKLPEIAENGATVPMTVNVESPMTSGNYVKSIHVAATANPNPEVVSFYLSPANGRATVSTRMRLAETQDVIATAVMNDGSIYRTQRKVKVTIGGCG